MSSPRRAEGPKEEEKSSPSIKVVSESNKGNGANKISNKKVIDAINFVKKMQE